jgi:hypothetical protein
MFGLLEQNASVLPARSSRAEAQLFPRDTVPRVTFELETAVPWGRSFQEYLCMFALDDADLRGSILGCGDGPASFNAVAASRGYRVVSADPIYRFSAAEIERRIDETAAEIAEQTKRNMHEFVWTHFKSVDELIEARLGAMREFLADYEDGKAAHRYVDASLPKLPFADDQFALALCSHLLFLYSVQHDADFHLESILELKRVAEEVRIFPLLELGAVPSRHLGDVTAALERLGLRVERRRVPYEFQKNGNEMLRIA